MPTAIEANTDSREEGEIMPKVHSDDDGKDYTSDTAVDDEENIDNYFQWPESKNHLFQGGLGKLHKGSYLSNLVEHELWNNANCLCITLFVSAGVLEVYCQKYHGVLVTKSGVAVEITFYTVGALNHQ